MIAARPPESEEYSYNGKYAELFNFKNKEQFASKIASIDKYRDALMECLEEGSTLVAQKFDRNHNASNFRKLLDNIN